MRCNKCRREAILFQEYSGQHLCRYHFEADLERKAKHEIRSHRWLAPGDHIAVALSGDAGSSALLYFLKKLTSNRRDIRISAITVDEGIAGHRDIRIASGIAGSLGPECIAVSFRELFGITIDRIADQKGIINACTYCRVIRDFLLNTTAAEHGVTKLASGEDLDDRSTRVMEHILSGTPGILVHPGRGGRGKIPWIRPFAGIPGREVALYASLHVRDYDQSRCPYDNNPFEEDVRKMLNELTARHPAKPGQHLFHKPGTDPFL
jgi:tRNA(Ile)-lysidine synthase TilS/MesJ